MDGSTILVWARLRGGNSVVYICIPSYGRGHVHQTPDLGVQTVIKEVEKGG